MSEERTKLKLVTGSLSARMADLIEQWERRLGNAESLLADYQMNANREGQVRMSLKVRVIRSMLTELKREFSLAEK